MEFIIPNEELKHDEQLIFPVSKYKFIIPNEELKHRSSI